MDIDLMHDPRPEIVQDSATWGKLLRRISTLEDRDKAMRLQTGLWQIRAMGARIRLVKGDNGESFRIVPLLQAEGGIWESEQEYREIVGLNLGDCAAEIKSLIQQVTKR